MSEFIGAFGRTTEIKPIKTQGVTRIVIEIPIEHHVQATAAFYDKDVIVTLGKNENGRYGVFTPDSEPEGKEPNNGKFYQELFKQGWFYNPRVVRAFDAEELEPPERKVESIKNILYDTFDVDSLKQINPHDFIDQIEMMGIKDTLPMSALEVVK